MCPLCVGSALLALTGAGSAGGLAVIVARVAGANPAPHAQDSGEPSRPADQMMPPDGASARNPDP
jgi:hypothetical protein